MIRAYNLLGRALVPEGRDDEATPAFQQVLRMQPRNLDATGALATSHSPRRFDAAITATRTTFGWRRRTPRTLQSGFGLRQREPAGGGRRTLRRSRAPTLVRPRST